MSIRRLRILIEHLPPESATKTALRRDAPPPADESTETYRPDLAPWSSLEVLMASLLDAVRLNTHVLMQANGATPGEFIPTPRPGVQPTKTSPKRLTDEQRRVLDPRLRNEPREA